MVAVDGDMVVVAVVDIMITVKVMPRLINVDLHSLIASYPGD